MHNEKMNPISAHMDENFSGRALPSRSIWAFRDSSSAELGSLTTVFTGAGAMSLTVGLAWTSDVATERTMRSCPKTGGFP